MAANKTSSFNERIHRREGIIVVDYSPKTVGAYRIRPDVSEHEMIAMNKISSFNGHPRCRESVMVVDYSPKTVGAYRIRPDVGEYEMIAANNASLFNGHPRRCEGVCDTPLHIYHLFVCDSFFVGVVPLCFSLAIVGAYHIRPSCERR